MRTTAEIHADLLNIIENGANGYSLKTLDREVDQLAAAAGHDGATGGGATPADDAREMVAVLQEIGAI